MPDDMILKDVPTDMLGRDMVRKMLSYCSYPTIFAIAQTFPKCNASDNKDILMRVIKKIGKAKDIIQAQLLLADYRATRSYHRLLKIPFNKMDKYQVACFVLTRKPEETKRIKSTRLKEVIDSLQQELPKPFLDSLSITLLAIQYSEENDVAKKQTINQRLQSYLNLRSEKCPAPTRVFINLSGINLGDINLSKSDLGLVDFTKTVLTNSTLCRYFSLGCSFVDANLSNANWDITDFATLEKFFNYQSDSNYSTLGARLCSVFTAPFIGAQVNISATKSINLDACHGNNLIQFFDVKHFKTVDSLKQFLDHMQTQPQLNSMSNLLLQIITAHLAVMFSQLKMSNDIKLAMIDAALEHPVFQQGFKSFFRYSESYFFATHVPCREFMKILKDKLSTCQTRLSA